MTRDSDGTKTATKSHGKRWVQAGAGLVTAGFLGAVGTSIFGWWGDAIDTRAPLNAHVDLIDTSCQSVVVDATTRAGLETNSEPTIEWALERGGGAWSQGSVKVVVQGRSDAAVVLQRFVVSDVVRSELPAAPTIVSHCDPAPRGADAGLPPRYYSLDLDADVPRVVLTEGTPDLEVVEFPYQVSASDSEVFFVSTKHSQQACRCRWRLGIEWISGDDSGVLDLGLIDTIVAPDAPYYKWAAGKWIGPYTLD
ncbi:hypothetical protein [Homoserinimonas sp. OAct 916]|uniref:hypothetical protein n=1 Tax=Homoserinimonas sp. OAct 916 TaxID=2211450 RepID=UPI000DBE8EA8|nr:hypothetical protein [Homoserinimonas sp. OAct 916]